MAPPSHLVCSPGSAVAHLSCVLSSRPLPAFSLSLTRPRAAPLSRVLAQMWLFSPAPYYRRTAALTRSTPCGRVSPSNGRMSAAPRNARWTLQLPVPRDCGQVPACSRKSLRDSVAAAPQGLWKITTHIWHQASPSTTLPQHQRMWLPSRVCWDQVASTVSTECPSSSGTAFPVWPENLPDPTLFLGIRPFHQSTARYRAGELQPLRSPCLQS